MTHPTEIKPREGDFPGTAPAQFEKGATLPELRFTIDDGIIDEYIKAIDGSPEAYSYQGKATAPPSVLGVYLLAILYRKYPPIQGIIVAKQNWRFHQPIYRGRVTEIVASGTVDHVEERRGKDFVRWLAVFKDAGGATIATATNEFYAPKSE